MYVLKIDKEVIFENIRKTCFFKNRVQFYFIRLKFFLVTPEIHLESINMLCNRDFREENRNFYGIVLSFIQVLIHCICQDSGNIQLLALFLSILDFGKI